ncbi:SMC-Scp complex subunit ScpB [Krasilnikovia sp. MM14-A1259]|uniref:SMC-Scp complex subunit ScpB n=1 Tax=Krasilnikovia sp. MM14-A1259 TaxID=3373539 RepID=UPI003817B379
MTDERPESLAAQAASWVPPWERPPLPPDRAYQEAAVRAEEAAMDAEEAAELAEQAAAQAEDAAAQAEDAAVKAEDGAAHAEEADESEAPVDAVNQDENGISVEALYSDEPSVPVEVLHLAEPSVPVEALHLAEPGVPIGALGADEPRTVDEPEAAPAPMDDAELRAALEAILLVVDEPVAELQLAQILEEPAERVAAVLEDISAGYTAAGHGFDLRRAAGGWRLYTRPEYARYVERFVLDGQSVRLTQAALETLAVVAYKQPVTRSRISAIRGVNCDGVMRTLVTRGLIEECGTERETGAFLYRTTALFLEKLGLNSVDELPPLAPFLPDDVEEVLDASG